MDKNLAIARMCLDCAESIYANTPPSPAYAERFGRLLFGTACAESLLIYRRQVGFHDDAIGGAWGLWQTEYAPVSDSVRLIETRPVLATRCLDWLESHSISRPWWIMHRPPLSLMRFIGENDALAVLFARLHYLRFPSPVPVTLTEQSQYWKDKYNTRAGAGTVSGYLEKWRVYGGATWEHLLDLGASSAAAGGVSPAVPGQPESPPHA